MTNSQIVECIYRDYDKEITNYIFNKLFHKDYIDDLKQDVYTRLLTLNNDLLYDLYFTTGVMFYIKRMVLNFFNHPRELYQKNTRIRANDIPMPEIYDDVNDEEDEEDYRIKIISDILDKSNFFCHLYRYKLLHNKTDSDIGSDLNINIRTLRYRFKFIKNEIKKEIEGYDKK